MRLRHLAVSMISILAAACGGAPSTKQTSLTAPQTATSQPQGLADSPVTPLAREMCALALSVMRGEPLRFERLHFEDVERHGVEMTPLPPCLAVTFDVRTELLVAPSNDVRLMQTNFFLDKQRLSARTHSHGSSPDIHVVSNVAAFPEIERLYDVFVDAVLSDHATGFQASALECQHLGVSERGKCEADMSRPVVDAEDIAALTVSGQRRVVRLESVYVFARAATGELVRMQLTLAAPTLVLEAEVRGP